MKFTHLNRDQRYQIEWRLASGHSKRVIALALGIHVSTIYRECARGDWKGRYCAEKAHAGALKRRAISAANHPVKPDSLWALTRRCLRQDWSPEQIDGRLGVLQEPVRVSAQGIYDWLDRHSRPESLMTHLRRERAQTPWRESHGGMPRNRPSIRKRPNAAMDRREAGHWEGDTVRGKTAHHCLVTLVERKSLYSVLSGPLRKCSDVVAKAVRIALRDLPALSLTLDNGTEFAAFASMGLPVFFADPGKPRQRARNENTNGLIRQYVSRKTRLTTLSDSKIKTIQDRLNHRPRKSLGFLTPHEVLFNLPPTPFAIRD